MQREETLLRQLRHRRQRALEAAIDRYGSYAATVVRNVLGAAGSMEDAEEVTADVFFALWQHAVEIQPGKLRPWLGAVARNRARDLLRKRKPVLPMDEDVLQIPGESLEDAVLSDALRQDVYRAVDAMGEPDREIFLRYYYRYETMEEIADRMAIPIGTVKSKLHRGRQRLKALFSEQEAEI